MYKDRKYKLLFHIKFKEYLFRIRTFKKSGGEFNDRYIIIDWNTEH